jgi:hypothetical protein
VFELASKFVGKWVSFDGIEWCSWEGKKVMRYGGVLRGLLILTMINWMWISEGFIEDKLMRISHRIDDKNDNLIAFGLIWMYF